jgi:epoxyqueuosine reductase
MKSGANGKMFNSERDKNTFFLKEKATEIGFSFCGISKAEFLSEEARGLEEWLKRRYHGSMGYMENHFDKRLDPTLLVPGAKTVVSLLFNYFPTEDITAQSRLKVAKYAYGEDYHFVIREKLESLLSSLREVAGGINGRVFVDSAPVMERAWAKKGGLGWIGKNTLLINKQQGSYFFIAEMIIDLELNPDGPVKDYCGTCTACMDACPTDAIPAPYVVDASKCISYYTIELKDEIPAEAKGKMEDWIFGCDICQDVCPWNRFSKPHQEQRFDQSAALLDISKGNWSELTEEVFNKVFAKSPLKRTKYSGLKRNIEFALRASDSSDHH